MKAHSLSSNISEALASVIDNISIGAPRADALGQFPVDSVRALRTSGLLAITVECHFGGLGGGLSDVIAVTRKLAESCLSTAFIFAMHCQQVEALKRFASRPLKERLLPELTAGGLYIASVTTEKSNSSILTASQPLQNNGEFRAIELHREAPIVTGGAHADGFLIKMRSCSKSHPNAVTWCYASRDQLEIETGTPWQSLGMRGVENVPMSLSGTIPHDQLLASGEAAQRLSAEVLAPMAHLGWSAAWLGAAHGVFRQLLLAIRRGQLPHVTLTSDLTRHRLARLRLRLESSSSYLYGVLAEINTSRTRGESLMDAAVQIHINSLKVIVAEETYKVANEMVELVGLQTGYCETSHLPFERLLRDLRSASLNYDDTKLLSVIGTQCALDPAQQLLEY